MWTNAIILSATALVAGLLLHPRLSGSRRWRATVTPLASIIGSGFLVIGPVLDASFGWAAPAAMAALCAIAAAFGAAIRFNIARLERAARRTHAEERLETLASWLLAGAYVISVCYYLNLLGAFAVRFTGANDPVSARLVTTFVLLFLAYVGWTHGFRALEGLEKVSVSIKLAIIAGLLSGLWLFFGHKAAADALVVNSPTVSGWAAATLLFGLIVTVQGFETSRYLGAEYTASERNGSMVRAQMISSAIYMAYILPLAFLFPVGAIPLSETAIIPLMEVVAPILPGLLVAAALASQFSAAVADTAGSGGLVQELTHGRLSTRAGYLAVVAVGLGLTWSANVFEIIAYASRAFAAYYAAQSAIAALGARAEGRPVRTALLAGLAALGAAAALFGVPVEG